MPFAWPWMVSLASVIAATSTQCEEQMSVLQVMAEQNASNSMVKRWNRWQDVAQTIDRLKDKLDEEEKNAQEAVVKEEEDKKKKIAETRLGAAKAANAAVTKAVPAIKACITAAAGKCDSLAVWTGVSNGVAELGPLITAFTKYGQYIPMVGNLLGLAGQLLGLLVGDSPGKSPAPISIDDMKKVVSQELYNFEMKRSGWKLQGTLEAINHLLHNYGGVEHRNDPAEIQRWFEKNLDYQRNYVFPMIDDMSTAYISIVGAGDSFRADMAKLNPFSSSCRKGRTVFEKVPGTSNKYTQVLRNVESCVYEKGPGKQECRRQGDTAATNWETLDKALGHWKALALAVGQLRSVMESIVLKGGGCCFEGEESMTSKCKNHCGTLHEWRTKFEKVSERAETVKKNLEILKGPSCAAKPVPWALGQTSTSCPDKFHCNYGYLVFAPDEKCPAVEMAQLWTVPRYSIYSCEQEEHMHKSSIGWKHVSKTLIIDKEMTAPFPEDGKPMCQAWKKYPREMSICAERNYCVEQPCLNFFTDDKVW